jgi:glutamate-5-semialdehyde dehydrogenase
MDFSVIARRVKEASYRMANTKESLRNQALASIASALEQNKDLIFAANAKDLERAAKDNLPGPILARLKFNEGKLTDALSGIQDLSGLSDPLFRTLLKRELDEGLLLEKVTCPIGVIGVIFESRPDALIQISTLCIKSGNCAILKGGSEAAETNRVLFEIIFEAGNKTGLPEGFVTLVESRSEIQEMLKCHESIDLIIPRGSNEFVQYIMANSKIPVMGHADGICHVYVDQSADLEKAAAIIVDSKTQYVAACNAVETVLLHKDAPEGLMERVNQLSDVHIQCRPAESEADYKEYLDYILTIKTVDSMGEAISHINHYGSHHTDCIVTEDLDAADIFMNLVDSAGVYHNCSTRFADGYRYGFGAEVGISTGKLHARGPVGLEGLVTYKYKLHGSGQIVADYATGVRSFHFKDMINEPTK